MKVRADDDAGHCLRAGEDDSGEALRAKPLRRAEREDDADEDGGEQVAGREADLPGEPPRARDGRGSNGEPSDAAPAETHPYRAAVSIR